MGNKESNQNQVANTLDQTVKHGPGLFGFGMLKDESPNLELSPNENLWIEFKKTFWGLLVTHWFLNWLLQNLQKSETPISPTTAITFTVFQILIIIGMVVLIGKYSFKFTKNKKTAILKSLLGLIWFGGIGIFLAYIAVQRDYQRLIGKVPTKRNKIIKIILIVFISLIVTSLAILYIKTLFW